MTASHDAFPVPPDPESPLLAMSHEELMRYAERLESQLTAVIDVARHWRDSHRRTVDQGYIAPFRYTLPELAETIRTAIFWADWPATAHRDIWSENADEVTS